MLCARGWPMIWLLLIAALLARGSEDIRDSSLGLSEFTIYSDLSLSHAGARPADPATVLRTEASTSLRASTPPPNESSSSLHGAVDDCCDCTYEAVDDINRRVVHPTLTALVRTAFFRFFKVNIHCDCPLWPDDGMCMLKACSVCVCDPTEVPQAWLTAEERNCSTRDTKLGQACDNVKCSAELASVVDRNVDPQIHANLLNLKGWRGYNNPWMAEGEQHEDYMYINLLANPERYTGYQGEHAHRIWNSIYGQECFANMDSKEKIIFYRLISGMHASISAHLSAKYLLDEQRGIWGPNLQEFHSRLGTPEMQSRVSNLYFSYLFVLQAVMKAGPLLEHFSYETGVAEEDALAAKLVKLLVHSGSVEASCPRPFDEGRLWQGESSQQLKHELQLAFQNITRVMDCVGCEKCKLWGKLQTLGIATALKILFSSSPRSQPDNSTLVADALHLERNEVIALVNLLERFASSIEYYRTMSLEVQRKGHITPAKPPAFHMFGM